MSYGLGYVEGTSLVMTDHAFCECWRRFSLERPTHSTSILHPTKELRGVDNPTWVQLAPKDGWGPVKIELGRDYRANDDGRLAIHDQLQIHGTEQYM